MSNIGMRNPYNTPPPLTTQPEGLLWMLGIQNAGQYPQHLATDWLLPTLDLLPWYLQQRAEIVSNANPPLNSIDTGDFVPFFEVPQGEHWVFLDMSLKLTVSTGSTGNKIWSLVRTRKNDYESMIGLDSRLNFDGTTSLPCITSGGGARGLLLRPSVQVGLYVEDGGTSAMCRGKATLRVVRLKTGS